MFLTKIMKKLSLLHIILIILLILIIFLYNHSSLFIKTEEHMTDVVPLSTIPSSTSSGSGDGSGGGSGGDYLQSLQQKENRIFPFRYFTDTSGTVLPYVAVTGFFRDDIAKQKYYEYLKNGIYIFGITAYKTFPNRYMLDKSEGEYERNDGFDYVGNITNWLCCFKKKAAYGFTANNKLFDMSESDFYTADNRSLPKKYDFIYICNKDSDRCPLDGWNAINRNYNLALKCFPMLCMQFNMKGLIVGRVNCGLEYQPYAKNLEITDWLEWHVLQDKMRESKMLFVPNVFDASPRVIAECITKNVPVLMNRNILCGTKYITPETGELFTDEVDIQVALIKMVEKIRDIANNAVSPRNWWLKHYSEETSQKKLRDFLYESFPVNPNPLESIDRVKFIL